MFSVGHIYFQQLCEKSSAMTNMMELTPVTDTDPNTVMVGVRVLVGSQDTTRVPSSSEIFVNLTVVRPSWVEFCFTREENKVSIKVSSRTRGTST